ncbi:MAG: hypothetical protein ACRC5C_14740, partial [Bacilli bacterium]
MAPYLTDTILRDEQHGVQGLDFLVNHFEQGLGDAFPATDAMYSQYVHDYVMQLKTYTSERFRQYVAACAEVKPHARLK